MSYINKQGTVVLSSFNLNGFTVYPITHNLVDLFWGNGFTNHARFKYCAKKNGDDRHGDEWVLWNKSSTLPRGFQDSLSEYTLTLKGNK